jgi:GNAT superfamily N-acetyltransferase
VGDVALIEAAARAAGCVRLALNLFTPNRGAIALYEQTGFAAVTQYMNKRLLETGRDRPAWWRAALPRGVLHPASALALYEQTGFAAETRYVNRRLLP